MSNDTFMVQRGVVGKGGGDDTYILSENLIDANASITITDTEGSNVIQLIGGLGISSSVVASDTVQLTLTNGAAVTVLGASTMQYMIGGDPLLGISGSNKAYEEFAIDILGTEVSPSGVNNGGSSSINADGTADISDPSTGNMFVIENTTDTTTVSGSNYHIIQLAGGVVVTASEAGLDDSSVKLTLTNGSIIQVNNASDTVFLTGGDSGSIANTVSHSYTDFTQNVLGISSTDDTGRSFTVNEDGTTTVANSLTITDGTDIAANLFAVDGFGGADTISDIEEPQGKSSDTIAESEGRIILQGVSTILESDALFS